MKKANNILPNVKKEPSQERAKKQPEILKQEIKPLIDKYKLDEKSTEKLLLELNRLPTNLQFREKANKEFPRFSERTKAINKLAKLSKNLYDVLCATNLEILTDFNRAFDDKIKKENIVWQLEDRKWYITNFKDELRMFEYICCRCKLNNISPDKGGRKPYSEPREALVTLIGIYEAVTNKKVTCGYNDISKEYVGDFYKFLLYIKPLLKKLGIRLGTDGTIGKYASEVIKLYRDWEKENKEINSMLNQMSN